VAKVRRWSDAAPAAAHAVRVSCDPMRLGACVLPAWRRRKEKGLAATVFDGKAFGCVVETRRIELPTFALRTRRSPS
jgi:hypothetical protein